MKTISKQVRDYGSLIDKFIIYYLEAEDKYAEFDDAGVWIRYVGFNGSGDWVW